MDETTLTGLGIISSLATLLIKEGVKLDKIATACFENSRKKEDLGDLLGKILEE